MIAIVNLAAFGLLTVFLGLCLRERIVDVLPVAVCVLILLLYVLAFPGWLYIIDWIGAAALLLAAVFFLRMKAERKRELLGRMRKELTHPGVFVAVLLLAGTAFLVRGRIVTWWDDLNFWAADVKALYAMGGFAAKYTNVAPEFGDYPPATSLIKWWFVHFSPKGFSEGLMFAGYYFGLFVFLMPLLRRLKGKNPATVLLATAGLWAFPGVAELFYTQGMCADLVMAAIYGAFLAAVTDREGHSPFFYYLRPTLYLSVLVLTKSVGFLWAGFGLIWFGLYQWKMGAQTENAGAEEGKTDADEPKTRPLRNKAAGRLLPVAVAACGPLLAGGSWMVFCLLMRRAAKLTGAAFSMAAGNLPILLPETKTQLFRSFAEAFLWWPLHRERTWGIDFSPLALFVFLCCLIFAFRRLDLLKKWEAGLLACFLPVSGIVFYGINLMSHLTIFAAETQYLEPYAMISSIERYGAPFTIGSLYLFAYLLTERWGRTGRDGLTGGEKGEREASGKLTFGKQVSDRTFDNRAYLICFCFVLFTSNWAGVYDGLHGYRQRLEQDERARREMISEKPGEFLELAATFGVGRGMRVLYLRDVSENRWTENTYVAYQASPVSLVFGGVDGSSMNSGDIWNALEASHAGYLYLDEIDGDMEALFAAVAEEVRPQTLYRIRRENGNIRLEEAQGN